MYKKVDIKLHNVYINYHVFIYRKVDIKLRQKLYHHVFNEQKMI